MQKFGILNTLQEHGTKAAPCSRHVPESNEGQSYDLTIDKEMWNNSLNCHPVTVWLRNVFECGSVKQAAVVLDGYGWVPSWRSKENFLYKIWKAFRWVYLLFRNLLLFVGVILPY